MEDAEREDARPHQDRVRHNAGEGLKLRPDRDQPVALDRRVEQDAAAPPASPAATIVRTLALIFTTACRDYLPGTRSFHSGFAYLSA
ncbi:MAG: hypothetical protein ACOCX2_05120 [Armatimonadota bacterium]